MPNPNLLINSSSSKPLSSIVPTSFPYLFVEIRSEKQDENEGWVHVIDDQTTFPMFLYKFILIINFYHLFSSLYLFIISFSSSFIISYLISKRSFGSDLIKGMADEELDRFNRSEKVNTLKYLKYVYMWFLVEEGWEGYGRNGQGNERKMDFVRLDSIWKLKHLHQTH